MQQRHHRVTHLHWKGFLIERLNWGVKKVSGKTPFFSDLQHISVKHINLDKIYSIME